MQDILTSHIFGITLTLLAYELGCIVYKKIHFPLFSPFVIAIIVVISVLSIFKIPYSNYKIGGDVINMILTPATSALAISMYHKIKILKQNLLPIIIGTFVGALVSVTSIAFMCNLFKLDEPIKSAMLPKSVTVPIAVDLAEKSGGIVPITIACVCLTGIFGAIFSPYLIRLFKLKNPIAIGLAIGSSSHGIGTSKALEIGETEGAISSLAIALSGIMTVIIYLFL